MDPKPPTMLDYYQEQAFNPVLIRVEDPAVWQDHVRKRRNLYERHLGIPLALLEGKRVLEFGCNSGENALVLASFGARLTFAEPNRLVAPRLEELFRRFGLQQQIEAFHEADIAGFQSQDVFDLVIAEGFLCTLDDRDRMLAKILGLIKPGGFGVISFNDRIGGLLEMLKRAVLFGAYDRLGVADCQSPRALAVAEVLFLEDFQKLKASRNFATWWRDTMVAPIYFDRYLWSYPDILAVLEAQGIEAQASSPAWSTRDHFTWYKNVPEAGNRRFLEEWKEHLAYFVTGFQPDRLDRGIPAPAAAVADAQALVGTLSDLAEGRVGPEVLTGRPHALLDHLRGLPDPRFGELADELGALFRGLAAGSTQDLTSLYLQSPRVRSAWGTAYHYLSFRNSSDPGRH